MPGRSAGDRSQRVDRDATGPADRLSLTVSVLLIGGLLLATAALYQNARIDKPKTQNRSPAPATRQVQPAPAARQTGSATMVIRLPPPPVSRRGAAKKTAAAQRKPPKPAPRAVKKPRLVKPLKQTVATKPVRKPATNKPFRIKPLKPAKPAAARPAPRANPAPDFKPVKQPSKKPVKTPGKIVPSNSAVAAIDGTRNTKAGGALLRLLEHGQGPVIEIAWPQRADARRALYRQLTQCFGVRAALLTGTAGLYADAGRAGETWSIDMDRFSGFIRSPRGEAIAEETRLFGRIAAHHGLTDWRPVRVFPRHVDAALLGGLGAVLGPLYKSARQIRAAYRWDRARLILGNFIVDGRPLDGAVALPLPRGPARGPGCD